MSDGLLVFFSVSSEEKPVIHHSHNAQQQHNTMQHNTQHTTGASSNTTWHYTKQSYKNKTQHNPTQQNKRQQKVNITQYNTTQIQHCWKKQQTYSLQPNVVSFSTMRLGRGRDNTHTHTQEPQQRDTTNTTLHYTDSNILDTTRNNTTKTKAHQNPTKHKHSTTPTLICLHCRVVCSAHDADTAFMNDTNGKALPFLSGLPLILVPELRRKDEGRLCFGSFGVCLSWREDIGRMCDLQMLLHKTASLMSPELARSCRVVSGLVPSYCHAVSCLVLSGLVYLMLPCRMPCCVILSSLSYLVVLFYLVMSCIFLLSCLALFCLVLGGRSTRRASTS